MVGNELEIGDTPIWRIYRQETGKFAPVLSTWYSGYDESRFLTSRTFVTEQEARAWLREFWQAVWKL